jgi:2-methylisocitrate lyase-like PEP mutase family enzyme
MPPSVEALREVCQATAKPVNALAAGPFTKLSQSDFASLGVARISLGSALARTTHRAVYDAAQAMFGYGDFAPLGNGIAGSKVDELLLQGTCRH